MTLRTFFKTNYPENFVSALYPGYMDMTYFSFIPTSIRSKKLRIAIVFLHDTCRFDVWLAGYNKQIQTKYWKLLRECGWNKYRIPSTTSGVDSIVEYTLINNPDFRDLKGVTKHIEQGTLKFIKDVEDFLSTHENK